MVRAQKIFFSCFGDALPAFIIAFVFSFFILTSAVHGADTKYKATGETCDGFPKLPIETIEGTCIGLVMQDGDGGVTFKKPRKITQIKGKDAFLLTDMGGWGRNSGSLFLISRLGAGYSATVLLEELDLPHQILPGPGNRYYLGEAHRIVSFELDDKNNVKNLKAVVEGLPAEKGNMHPLSHFVFLENNDLLLNIGAPSDDCKSELSSGKCSTRESFAALRLYRYEQKTNSWSKDFELYAKGLRNSMALSVHPSGTILQSENNMDFDSDDEPYEEINVIERGKDYGWPYCYDNDAANPVWKRDAECRTPAYAQPWTLVPAHTAPLDMMYYTGSRIKALKGKLLVSWHGYRRTGHRIVAYDVDEKGRPKLTIEASYISDPGGNDKNFVVKPFKPTGSALPVARHTEITTAWNAVTGLRPKGAPVGLLQAEDESLWIVDDKNKMVLRLSNGTPWKPAKGKGATAPSAPVFIEDPKLSAKVASIFKSSCSKCHAFTNELSAGKAATELSKQGWIDMPAKDSKLYDAVVNTKRMPPDKPLSKEELAVIEKWLSSLRKK
ncbi:MAG: PQQ-dependent sugar dehydrogenase [Deltaproteobacteria bacterium]|nr:PQQ-dependent sugar dehydrogenase [Deltaproteobacteria bacterium]